MYFVTLEASSNDGLLQIPVFHNKTQFNEYQKFKQASTCLLCSFCLLNSIIYHTNKGRTADRDSFFHLKPIFFHFFSLPYIVTCMLNTFKEIKPKITLPPFENGSQNRYRPMKRCKSLLVFHLSTNTHTHTLSEKPKYRCVPLA